MFTSNIKLIKTHFASDFFVDKMILSFVRKDDVDFFGARSTNVRAKHDMVRRVSVHANLVQIRSKHFNVSTTTVNVLLVFH